MPRKLKVFRLPIGFEDAYVAAPSRQAALAAWGSEHDQFARGVAEEVTDPKLIEEPLAHPGAVIRRSRGDLATQLKAAPARRTKAQATAAEPASRQAPKPKPPPKRDKIDAAEAAIEEARRRHDGVIAQLEDEREAIETRLEALRGKRDRELAKLGRRRDAAREAYRDALENWSE